MLYKIDFESLGWELPMESVRHKYRHQDNIRVRLVEYSKEMPPHWCEKAHYGYVLEGIFEIEFDHETIRYEKGEGLFLPAGKNHRYKARTITDKVLIFFIEIQSNEQTFEESEGREVFTRGRKTGRTSNENN